MTPQYTPDAPSIRGTPVNSPAGRTAPQRAAFVSVYGALKIPGPAVVTLALGARAYGIPAGSRIGSPDDGDGRVLLVLTSEGALHMLTAAGEVVNLTPNAASALGDDVFGRPDARPPTP